MFKYKILKPLCVSFFIVGIAMLSYPTLSDKAISVKHKQIIKTYSDEVLSTPIITEEVLSLAEKYNDIVRMRGGYGFIPMQDELELYYSALSHNDNTIMGYISIPKLSISLPIYHSSSQAVLQAGIGHIESTSLPIGGSSNHSVLTGHSGMSSAKMFTKIDTLNLKDQFILNVQNEKLYYEIYNIVTVLPSEVELLKIQDGKDLCTLVTCTPYGSNTHRLLVQGKRIIL